MNEHVWILGWLYNYGRHGFPLEKKLGLSVFSDAIVVFSKTYCPFCTRTKNLLNEAGAGAKVYELDTMKNGASIQAAVRNNYGHGTVPAIFFDSKLIGGNDDLTALAGSGTLQDRITAAKAARK